MGQLYMLVALVLGLAVVMVVEHVSTERKRERRIRREFGLVPNPCHKRAKIPEYWLRLTANEPCRADVDDITWNDLCLDDVYDRVNVCQSAVGEDYLYATLRRPQQDAQPLMQREQLLHALQDEALRVKVLVLLSRLGKRLGTDVPALLFRAQEFSLPQPGYALAAAIALAVCGLLCFSGNVVAVLALAIVAAHNIWFCGELQKKLVDRVETVGYCAAMLRCAQQLQKVLQPVCPRCAALLHKAALPLGPIGKGAAGMMMTAIGTDAEIIGRMVGMATLLPVLQYHRAIKTVAAQKDSLRLLYRLLGELEVAAAVLSYRESLSEYTVPEFTDALQVHATGLVHPLLENGVPNDAHITAGWLLTGSNASGKSTFLKAVAVNNLLAQTLHTCTARTYTLQLAPVITSMAVEDSVIDGDSYFVAEIKSMRRIVAAVDSGEACYCFIDEILKGTNTVERVAASCAILRHLQAPNCLCLAATHDIELTQLLAGAYENRHFSEKIEQDAVLFDYTLKDGPCTTRNAIRLLSVYGFPQEIVERAREQAGEMRFSEELR